MYDDTTAVAGTQYYYWVTASNSAGTSGFSSSDRGERSTVITEVEPNNSYTTAQNLGAISTVATVQGELDSAADVDWYKFTLLYAGDGGSSIAVTNWTGQWGASVYSNPAKSGPVANSVNWRNSATVSLSGLAAGTYYVRVYGYATNGYAMQITPPAAPTAPQHRHGLVGQQGSILQQGGAELDKIAGGQRVRRVPQ